MSTRAHEKLNARELRDFNGQKERRFWGIRLRRLRMPHCPDCGAELAQGPRGGLSVNILCRNRETCGSVFVHQGPFGVTRVTNPSPLANPDLLQGDA